MKKYYMMYQHYYYATLPALWEMYQTALRHTLVCQFPVNISKQTLRVRNSSLDFMSHKLGTLRSLPVSFVANQQHN